MDDLVVTISGVSLRIGIPPYTEYEISVKVYIDKSYTVWKVARRYSEFLELYEYLCLKYNSIREYPFPPKTRLKRYFEDTVNERKHLLSLFLQKCLDDKNIFKEVNFRKFLDFSGSYMNMELKSKNQEDEASEDEIEENEVVELKQPPLQLIDPEIQNSIPQNEDKVEEIKEDSQIDNTDDTNDINKESKIEINKDIEGIAEYEFIANSERELSLKENQVVVITDSSNDEWYLGYLKDDPSKTGFFPKNYVKIAEQ